VTVRSRLRIPAAPRAAARPLLRPPARPAAGPTVPNSSRSEPLRRLAGPRWSARPGMEEFGTRSGREGFADGGATVATAVTAVTAVTAAAAGSPAERGRDSSHPGARPLVAPPQWPARPAMEEFGTEPARGGRS